MEFAPKVNTLVVDTETNENIESIDELIFERLKSINVSVLPNLKPDFESLKEQKTSFLNGDIVCPALTYNRLETVDFDKKEVELQTLKDGLAISNYPEPIVLAYNWIINEQIAKVRMLKETKQMSTDTDGAEQHALRFTKYSEFIYGAPKQPVFDTTLSYVESKIDSIPIDSELRDTEAFRIMTEMLGRIDYDLPKIPHLEAKEHGEIIVSIAEIVARFEEGLSKYGLDEYGWTVVVDETGERDKIAVNQATKQVLLPSESVLQNNRSKARALTPERIYGLIEHEIGTHALRARNGSQSELKLLQTGLDRYDVGEEGLATFREQLEAGTDDYAGFHGYFAAGLAKGLDNHGQRDFAGVFTVLKAYFELCEGEDAEKAKELAWLRCLRTFRGTTGQVPGAIFTKDILYREGNIKIHELHEQGLLNDEVANIGKYDVTNERHRKILSEIGVDLSGDVDNR